MTDSTFSLFKCYEKHEKQKFSLKVGTIFEDSPIGLDKWLPVMWLIANCRNGISSWEIHRDLGVTQKTAWFMLHRVRLAMQDDKKGGKLSGEVEVDETYIGGKENPYLLRWWVIPRNRFFNVYLHKFLRDDDDRALHDHPWLSLSVILKGGYVEHTAKEVRRREAGSIIFRRAKHAHRIELLREGFCLAQKVVPA